MAVFKVFYQHNRDEVIVRENTQSLYVEAQTEEQVCCYLKIVILISNLSLN